MLNSQKITLRQIYVIGALVFLLTAWFSVGYNHYDEHFQIIEFAGLKLGLTEKANLPWEYNCMMRPGLQPLLVYAIYKTSSALGMTNPFFISFLIRLFTGVLSFASILMLFNAYKQEITNRKLLYGLLLLSFFLWFIPYNSVRFSSETFSGRIFVIGFAWFLLRKEATPVDYLITGIILGVSFITRYQMAFMIVGFAAWLAVMKKSEFRNLIMFGTGIILVAALGVLIDHWYYGQWVLTSWNYFQQNILFNKAASFGTSPWWYYIEQTFMNAFPPLSLVYIVAVFLYFIFYPKNILTWTLLPFLAIHFMIPHKEIRFLFPLIGFLPVMIIKSADFLLKKNGYDLLEKRTTKISTNIFWFLNFIMLVVLTFRPADDQISLYKKIWDHYDTPVRLCYTDDNPYQRAKVQIFFYRRKCLAVEHVDSLKKIVPAKDTISLVVTSNPRLEVNNLFTPVMIYSSFPQWVTHFNINHWMERTTFWYIFELKPKSKP